MTKVRTLAGVRGWRFSTGRLALIATFVLGLSTDLRGLTMSQFRDCVTIGTASTCELDTGSGPYMIDTTINVSRSNIVVKGAYPKPVLKRQSGFHGELMKTTGSVSWTDFRDLKFDGNRSAFTPGGANHASLTLDTCSYCGIYYIDFDNSRQLGLVIRPYTLVQVGYSTFTNNAWFGIHYGSGTPCPYPTYWYPKRCHFVYNSTFTGNGANGIFYDAQQASINSNVFTSNHDESPFSVGGGQIDIAHSAYDVWFFYNTVTDGPSNAGGWFAMGVEIQGKLVDVHHNRIDTNGGDGIFMDSAQDVTIRDHKPLYGVDYRVYNNNRRGNKSGAPAGLYSQCPGGFPGIHVHTGQTSTSTKNITITNNNIYTGHDGGVDVTTCLQPASTPAITGLSITNNCLSGNGGGVWIENGAASSPVISNNPTTGCP